MSKEYSVETRTKMYKPRYINAVHLAIKLKDLGAPSWVLREIEAEDVLDLEKVTHCSECIYARELRADIRGNRRDYKPPNRVYECHRAEKVERHGGGHYCAMSVSWDDAGRERDLYQVAYKQSGADGDGYEDEADAAEE